MSKQYATITDENVGFESLFSLQLVKEGVYLCKELYYDSWNRANIWVLPGTEKNLVIDTGIGVHNLHEFLQSKDVFGGLPFMAVATHIHFDHSGGLHYFDDFAIHELEADFIIKGDNYASSTCITNCEVTHPPEENWRAKMYAVKAATPSRTLKDGDVIDIGDRIFKILHLPGHSLGSIGVLEESTGYFFSGDVAYEGPLIDWTPYSNSSDYVQSCQVLKNISHDIDTVFPGHNWIFNGEKLNEVVSSYEQNTKKCCSSVLRSCLSCLVNALLKGRNTSNSCGKCCYKTCCCCFC